MGQQTHSDLYLFSFLSCVYPNFNSLWKMLIRIVSYYMYMCKVKMILCAKLNNNCWYSSTCTCTCTLYMCHNLFNFFNKFKLWMGEFSALLSSETLTFLEISLLSYIERKPEILKASL